MIKVLRLTESELKNLVDKSARRIVQEQVDWDREIQLAQKEVYRMGNLMTSVGLRLNDTEFQPLFLRLKDALIGLNNALIKHIRGEK